MLGQKEPEVVNSNLLLAAFFFFFLHTALKIIVFFNW